MRYGPVIDTAAYVFVLLLSHFILKEKITRGKIIGNLIIIAGILIYTIWEPENPDKFYITRYHIIKGLIQTIAV